jgi:hypothetical protein
VHFPWVQRSFGRHSLWLAQVCPSVFVPAPNVAHSVRQSAPDCWMVQVRLPLQFCCTRSQLPGCALVTLASGQLKLASLGAPPEAVPAPPPLPALLSGPAPPLAAPLLPALASMPDPALPSAPALPLLPPLAAPLLPPLAAPLLPPLTAPLLPPLEAPPLALPALPDASPHWQSP